MIPFRARGIRYRSALVWILLAMIWLAPLRWAAGQGNDIPRSDTLEAILAGRWHGVIRGSFRGQQVAWRFELGDEGLRGYMAPAWPNYSNMPDIPMVDLRLQENRLQFTIPSHNASYEGVVGSDGVQGIWRQSGEFPLHMTRQVFAFDAPPSMREALAGTWETRVVGTLVRLRFEEFPPSSLIGHLSVPSLGLVDLPLSDLTAQSSGSIGFATENGRSFSGRWVNGVLLGEYNNNGRRYDIAFLDPADETGEYNLELDPATRDRLTGDWRGTVGGTPVAWHFGERDSGKFYGELLLGGNTRSPVLELIVQGVGFAITTLNQRYYSGEFDNGSLEGAYSVENRTYSARFSRTAP